MEFASLGSGSKGNGTLIRNGDELLLVDCGFTVKETEKRLQRLGVAPGDLDALIVTHEHGDHINGVGPLARKYAMPVYMTTGTWRSRDLGRIPHLHLIKNYEPFALKSIAITPVAVPHDACEPAQFVFKAAAGSLGLLTDLGSITPHVERHFYHCDALILEANHDPYLLAAGAYPPSLKQRVGGPWGHLSNQQAAAFLRGMDCERLQCLVVAHMSEQNNSLSLTKAALAELIAPIAQVVYACQRQGFDWLSLAAAPVLAPTFVETHL
ncbi:MAG: MBL fold metallo-hydrolase [Cellvibrionaceae bacterium]|nr:MBL fold metallo-hydrolase [Cellvibrionaceae bacterium]